MIHVGAGWFDAFSGRLEHRSGHLLQAMRTQLSLELMTQCWVVNFGFKFSLRQRPWIGYESPDTGSECLWLDHSLLGWVRHSLPPSTQLRMIKAAVVLPRFLLILALKHRVSCCFYRCNQFWVTCPEMWLWECLNLSPGQALFGSRVHSPRQTSWKGAEAGLGGLFLERLKRVQLFGPDSSDIFFKKVYFYLESLCGDVAGKVNSARIAFIKATSCSCDLQEADYWEWLQR